MAVLHVPVWVPAIPVWKWHVRNRQALECLHGLMRVQQLNVRSSRRSVVTHTRRLLSLKVCTSKLNY